MKKITIYDLAELSGVSASAVSAILNGNWKKRRISAKLAEKVTRIAEEQGYAINRQASMLRSKKSRVIGMIIPKYDNRYFGSVAERFPGRLTGWWRPGRPIRIKFPLYASRRACQRSISIYRGLSHRR